MGLQVDLEKEVAAILGDQWTSRNGTKVPGTEDVKLGNDAVDLDAVVLYADLTDSTGLVQNFKSHFAAEIYKAYLRCASTIIVSEGGAITSFDGDRVMAVFLGDVKCTPAARAALKINYAVKNIINPALKRQYPSYQYEVKQVVGVDRSNIRVVRGGIRGSNDLLWIGNAANIAAKLCSLSGEAPSWITKSVFDGMMDTMKTYNGRAIWEQRVWTKYNSRIIYRSSWTWKL